MKVGKYRINLEQHGSSPRESPISNTTLEVIIANSLLPMLLHIQIAHVVIFNNNRLVNIDYLIINPTCMYYRHGKRPYSLHVLY